MKRLKGVIAAIPTPLLATEDVDTEGLRRLIDMVIEDGATGVFVLGTMGEGVALLDDQKLLVAHTAARHINGTVPLLVSISEVSTRRTVQLALRLEEKGADFLVSTGPFFYKFPDSRSIVQCFQTLAESLSTPLVFYHQPGFAGSAYDVDTVDRVLSLPGVAALKDSSCNFALVGELLRRYPEKATRPFSLLQGDESIFDMTLILGADGVVTGGGVLFLKTLVQLYEAAVRQDRGSAFELQAKFRRGLMDLLGPNLMADWMAAVKNELKRRGICDSICTSPFLNRFADPVVAQVQAAVPSAELTT